MSCLRRIAGVTRRDRIKNKEVCDRVGLLERSKSHTTTANAVFWSCTKNGSYQISKTCTPWICAWDKKTRKTQEEMTDMVKDNCKQHDIDIHQATSFCMEEPGEAAYARICVATAISQVSR